MRIKNPIFLPTCLLLLFTFTIQAQNINYYGSKNKYSVELLQHVLAYSPDKNYQLIPFIDNMPTDRAFNYMAKNQVIDVVFAGATKQRVNKYQAIEFPLLKGLNGWRIPVVTTKNKNLFRNVPSLESFKKLTPGLFHLWSDTAIMQHNGIYVETGSSVDGLWQMLNKNRFDYFPRSILQVFHEIKKHPHLNIIIDPYSLIHYPTAYYFYVNKENNALAADIKLGLESALTDGSLELIFKAYYGYIIDRIHKQNRTVFSLENPLLPPSTPLARKELWLDFSNKSDLIN